MKPLTLEELTGLVRITDELRAVLYVNLAEPRSKNITEAPVGWNRSVRW